MRLMAEQLRHDKVSKGLTSARNTNTVFPIIYRSSGLLISSAHQISEFKADGKPRGDATKQIGQIY
jgi:hypothetical protein